MNTPATLVWARGLEMRAAEIRFEPPVGSNWKVASQLFSTPDPMVFTAPNLQYLMDSPTELSAHTLRTFTIDDGGARPTFRIALHHEGTEAEADAFARDVEKIVRETRRVYGEFPPYDTGTYTFLSDYLPYASGDGMEHRNSTVLTAPGALGNPAQRQSLLGTVAHEFFHGWNVERIRPRSLEPFDFERANLSGELWLAEGVTSYYDALLMRRAGLAPLEDTAADFASLINQVTFSPARRFRSAEDMSRLAPFVDAARSIDRTYWDNTFISYYTWGAAIGLGLDLSLRDRTDGRVTLDDFMRAMWRSYGKAGGPAPGLVSAPYTIEDAQARLAEVSGDPAFAADFFRRFIRGRDVVPYERLLRRAGLVLRKVQPGQASLGGVRLDYGAGGGRLTAPAPMGSPLYLAGLDQDDVIVSLEGEALASPDRLEGFLKRKRPGDRVTAVYRRRDGEGKTSVQLIEADPLEIVPIEKTGGVLDSTAKAFRDAWLASKS
jgi:predicted metalloprotease with PDZ domain